MIQARGYSSRTQKQISVFPKDGNKSSITHAREKSFTAEPEHQSVKILNELQSRLPFLLQSFLMFSFPPFKFVFQRWRIGPNMRNPDYRKMLRFQHLFLERLFEDMKRFMSSPNGKVEILPVRGEESPLIEDKHEMLPLKYLM